MTGVQTCALPIFIVRLGHRTADTSPEGSKFTQDIYDYIDEAYKVLGVRG